MKQGRSTRLAAGPCPRLCLALALLCAACSLVAPETYLNVFVSPKRAWGDALAEQVAAQRRASGFAHASLHWAPGAGFPARPALREGGAQVLMLHVDARELEGKAWLWGSVHAEGRTRKSHQPKAQTASPCCCTGPGKDGFHHTYQSPTPLYIMHTHLTCPLCQETWRMPCMKHALSRAFLQPQMHA